jgi:hypothetical protein
MQDSIKNPIDPNRQLAAGGSESAMVNQLTVGLGKTKNPNHPSSRTRRSTNTAYAAKFRQVKSLKNKEKALGWVIRTGKETIKKKDKTTGVYTETVRNLSPGQIANRKVRKAAVGFYLTVAEAELKTLGSGVLFQSAKTKGFIKSQKKGFKEKQNNQKLAELKRLLNKAVSNGSASDLNEIKDQLVNYNVANKESFKRKLLGIINKNKTNFIPTTNISVIHMNTILEAIQNWDGNEKSKIFQNN